MRRPRRLPSGRRIGPAALAGLLAAGTVAAINAGPASGFAVGEYSGHVKGDPLGEVAFDVEKIDGVKKVVGFLAYNVTYTCVVDPDDRSEGMEFVKNFRIHADGTFAGEGEVVILKGDPSGRLAGKLKAGGKASGTFRIKGELAGPGSDCKTGLQEWKAEKNPPTTWR